MIILILVPVRDVQTKAFFFLFCLIKISILSGKLVHELNRVELRALKFRDRKSVYNKIALQSAADSCGFAFMNDFRVTTRVPFHELGWRGGAVRVRHTPRRGATVRYGELGNTARRFFENSEVSCRIFGLKKELFDRFYVILQVLSSGFNVNVPLFESYCTETANLYVTEYSWYYMPTTVHKVLIHGAKIIQSAILPIGQLSEEAQEARNKDIRNYREHFSRKCSRKSTMEDIFHLLLVSSDPYISSLKKLKPKKGKALSSEALALLSYERSENHDTDSDNETQSEHDSGSSESDNDD